jgi:hypothetical protein
MKGGVKKLDRDATIREVHARNWTFLGIGFFVPGGDPTVDARGPDGHELRVYVPALYGSEGPPRCELTDMSTEMSLWVEGIPDGHQAGWLMRKHERILVSASLGVGDRILDLESGEVMPERWANRR